MYRFQSGNLATYARTVSFTVTHHVDSNYNTVRWTVEHPDRRCDAMFTLDTGSSKAGMSLDGTWSALLNDLNMQESRHQNSRR